MVNWADWQNYTLSSSRYIQYLCNWQFLFKLVGPSKVVFFLKKLADKIVAETNTGAYSVTASQC